MEQASSFGGSKRHEEPDFDLKEWALKAKISRENTRSRRFSASNLKSFREEAKSFRSSITISSTVSSPGYNSKEEIDPSTYSFTTALKALQAKTVYTWEYLSPEKYTLNSKWSDAEKYICNPLSGEFPLECLSAKTLSGRSFRSLTSRITMSAPLIYPSQLHHNQFQAKTPIVEHENEIKFTVKERKKSMTRDVGIQSTLVDDNRSSSSPSPARTPSIEERSMKQSELGTEYSPLSSEKLNTETEVVQEKATRGDDDDQHGKQLFTEKNAKKKVRKVHNMKNIMMMCLCNNREEEQEQEKSSSCSCISLKSLLVMRGNKDKKKSRDDDSNIDIDACNKPPAAN